MDSSSMWGLDLGQECLSAVFLQRVSGRYEIAKFTRIEYELPLAGQYPPEKKGILESAFRAFREQEGIGPEQAVAISLSGLDAVSRPVRLPPVSKRIEDLVDLEVSQNPPIPGKDFVYRFQMLPTDTLSERRIFLVAYPKAEIDAVLEAASRAKLRIRTLQSSPASLFNYLRFDLRNMDQTLLVHMRRDATDLVLGTEAGIWFRTIPEGANTLRTQLRRELGVPIGEAREILEDFLQGTPRTPYTIACDEFLDRVQRQIQKALDEQFLHFSFSQPQKVLVLGECARIPGTLTHFSGRFQCWVERIEKAQRVFAEPAILATLPGKCIPASGAAIGAALQGLGAVAGTPSFADGSEKTSRQTESASLATATAAIPTESLRLAPAGKSFASRLARVAAIAAFFLTGGYAFLQAAKHREVQERLEAGQRSIAPAELQLALRREMKGLQENLHEKRMERDLLVSFAKNDRSYANACASLSRILPGNAYVANGVFSQSATGSLQGEFFVHYPGTAASLETLLEQTGLFPAMRFEDLGLGRFRIAFASESGSEEEGR